MFMKQDWFMRQIEVLASAIAQLVFGGGGAEHEHREEGRENGGEALNGALWALVANGEIGRAEDLLFARLDWNDQNSLALALEFYQKLNRMTDEDLEAGGFSRQEVWEGLQEAARRFGLRLPGFTS